MEVIILMIGGYAMNIPFKSLQNRLKNNAEECKSTSAYENNVVSHAFLGILVKLINRFENCSEYETGLFVKSFDKWLDRKSIVNMPEGEINVTVGDICMIDWNINYNPELSYIHPGLIIEDVNNMISVLPVSSSNYKEAFHPIDNPNGNKYYRRVNISDGFQKECTIFLDGLKVISKSRITRKLGTLTCDLKDEDGLFREIRWRILDIYFPYEYSVLRNIIIDKDNKLEKIEELRRTQQSRADKYRIKNNNLEKEIEKLKEQIDKNI